MLSGHKFEYDVSEVLIKYYNNNCANVQTEIRHSAFVGFPVAALNAPQTDPKRRVSVSGLGWTGPII